MTVTRDCTLTAARSTAHPVLQDGSVQPRTMHVQAVRLAKLLQMQEQQHATHVHRENMLKMRAASNVYHVITVHSRLSMRRNAHDVKKAKPLQIRSRRIARHAPQVGSLGPGRAVLHVRCAIAGCIHLAMPPLAQRVGTIRSAIPGLQNACLVPATAKVLPASEVV